MLDESIADVRSQNPGSDLDIRTALMKKIRIYHYVPKGVEGELSRFSWKIIKKPSRKSNTKKFE